MSIETWALNEEDKKRFKISEEEKKQEIKKVIESEKKKEEIRSHMEADEQLSHLQELLDTSDLDDHTKKIIEKVVDWEEISSQEIQEIFEKIDQIENIKDVDKYIPEKLRISKEEYSHSLHDEESRKKTIQKIDNSLWILSQQLNTGHMGWLNLFSGFLAVLDKNLILIQEHTIDIKRSLEEKNTSKSSLSLWERFIQLLKDIFI